MLSKTSARVICHMQWPVQVRPVHNRSKCIFKCQVLKEDRPAWYLIISEMTFHVIPSVVMQLWGEFQRSTAIALYSLLIHYFLRREMKENYFLSGLAFHLTNEKSVALSFCVCQQSLDSDTYCCQRNKTSQGKKQV